MLFCLPETLYHREGHLDEALSTEQSWLKLFIFSSLYKRNRPKAADFLHVFTMLKYPSVLLPTIYYSISFGLGSVLFAVTGAAAFGSIYDFDTAQVGLAIGLSTFVGTIIGELSAGRVSDRILYLRTRKSEGAFRPEARLLAIWPGFFLCPAGVIIEGVCLQYRTHWSGPVVGIGIAAFGLQIITTNVFAYCTDCYKPQAAEIGTLLNFGRQIFSFTLGFYMVPFALDSTWGVAWSVLAIINATLFIGIIALMWRGQQWRQRLGQPSFNMDL